MNKKLLKPKLKPMVKNLKNQSKTGPRLNLNLSTLERCNMLSVSTLLDKIANSPKSNRCTLNAAFKSSVTNGKRPSARTSLLIFQRNFLLSKMTVPTRKCMKLKTMLNMKSVLRIVTNLRKVSLQAKSRGSSACKFSASRLSLSASTIPKATLLISASLSVSVSVMLTVVKMKQRLLPVLLSTTRQLLNNSNPMSLG